ncbi:MAG TPA: metallopeptidase TldD-related protein, partial [Mycobacterium sp.]
MIPAQQVVELALAAATVDETVVIVTDRAEASLRWAGNSMTTNGVSTTRSTTVISIVRKGNTSHTGSIRTSDVDPTAIGALVAAAEQAAHAAPDARDSAPLLTDSGIPDDWNHAVPETGAELFADVAESLSSGFGGTDRLYGYAHHLVETTFLATSTGLRRRFTQPTGTVEINAKRDGASAWAGVSTPWFNDVPTDAMLDDLALRLGWAQRTVELPAGRYETLMPPSTVADMMIYLGWSMDGHGAQEGRTALSAPGGGTRVGEKLTELPLTMYSDPFAPGLECAPFVAATSSSERISVFDNGIDISRVDWIRDGTINALAYPRAAAAEFGVHP